MFTFDPRFRDHLIADQLKHILYQKMMSEFGDRVYSLEQASSDKSKEHIQLVFFIEGREETTHEFTFPVEAFVLKEDALYIIEEMKKYDESLTDNVMFSYTTINWK